MSARMPVEYWRGTVDEKLEDHEEKLDDHGKRIGVLEKGYWRLGGMLAATGFLGSLAGGGAVSFIVYRLTH